MSKILTTEQYEIEMDDCIDESIAKYGYDKRLRAHDDALRAENERLRAAATEALAVLTRLADSDAYWSEHVLPVGIFAEIDSAKARLAGVLS